MRIALARSRATALAAVSLVAVVAALPAVASARPAHTTVVASGLNSPRGLTFGPNGGLVVAEGGRGGSNSTVGRCRQATPPIGPYTGGRTARISRIGMHGKRTTVVRGLPSDQTSPESGGLVSGVADVTFIGRHLYALISGGGCSHGNPGFPNSVVRVHGGHASVVANLSRFLRAHPPANPSEDFEPDGTWYGFTHHGRTIFAVDPNQGHLVRIGRHGGIRQIADLSKRLGHVVPTAITWHRGALYFSNLTVAPFPAGAASVWRATPNGKVRKVAGGLATVVGLRFDGGKLYALQSSAGGATFGAPGSGSVVRVRRNGSMTTVVEGLTRPGAMAFKPGTHTLYITVNSFGGGPGDGQVVRAHLG